MVRKLLIVLALLVPGWLRHSYRLLPFRPAAPAGPTEIRWEIIAYPKGGKGGLRVLERITGSQARVEARTAYLQVRYPNLAVSYWKAR